MRNYFLDSSALVKVYAEEQGSEHVRSIIRGVQTRPPASRVMLSRLTHPEAASALDQIMSGPHAARRGFGSRERRVMPGILAAEFGAATRLQISDADPHMDAAAALVWKHKVRGADAVQLATALAVRMDLPEDAEFYFVSSDVSLNAAAAAEGLEVIDPAA